MTAENLYKIASAMLDEADAERKKVKLKPFTKVERDVAITYFCEGVRYARKKKGLPVDEPKPGEPPGSWMLEPDSPH